MFRIENINYTGVSEIIINNIIIVIDRGTWGLCFYREPCFILSYRLGDVQTYRETYKTEKNDK